MGLCKKPLAFHLATYTAKFYFEWMPFCLILRSKMRQNGIHSKFSFAAEGGGILFTQPHTFETAFLFHNIREPDWLSEWHGFLVPVVSD